MSSKTNIYQRPYVTQRSSADKKNYSCIIYVDQPSKYSIVDSKRLTNIDDKGYGVIRELGTAYHIHVEQTGTEESMEKYGRLLEKAMHSEMHSEVPSDCEEWRAKKRTEGQSTTVSTPIRPNSKPKPSNKQQKQDEIAPAALPSQSKSFNNKSISDAHTQDEKESDRDSPMSNDDEEDEYIGKTIDIEEQDLSDDEPIALRQRPPSIRSKKRSSKSKTKIPVAKRFRLTADEGEENHEEKQMNLQQLINYVKEVNGSILKVQKKQDQIMVNLERQERLLNILSNNQKKLAKCFTRRKIPVLLENDDENATSVDSNLNDLATTFNRRDGVIVDLLKIPGIKENAVKYALTSMDALFINEQDLQNANVKKIDEDPRIQTIYNAIRRKFNFSIEQMSVVWPQVHDSILSKRRNQKQKLKLKAKQNESILSNIPLQVVIDNNYEQQGEKDEEAY